MTTISDTAPAVTDARPIPNAMLRGALMRCPHCGTGHLYRAYLKVADACPACGEELHHHRADDAPPYVTIFFVGHLVIASLLAVDIAYDWPVWLHMAVWLPLTVVLCLALLPMFKGALIGLQWALRMHGFGGPEIGEAASGRPSIMAS
ncbi:MAG TPA: DUF983 domain-containing protein [Lichenihabitans sp.]|jgi:uncharacterized protein (DUF983 family)|nr:DUF983 domain-containing protein [Lichenihabitans sp.]